MAAPPTVHSLSYAVAQISVGTATGVDFHYATSQVRNLLAYQVLSTQVAEPVASY
jgi:hypothetical protein